MMAASLRSTCSSINFFDRINTVFVHRACDNLAFSEITVHSMDFFGFSKALNKMCGGQPLKKMKACGTNCPLLHI